MAENQAWIVAELARGGDPETVVAAFEELHDAGQAQHQGDTVVFNSGRPLAEGATAPKSVAEHISRVLYVDSLEGGDGQVRSQYYDEFTGDGEPDEQLSTPFRWFAEAHFDYYAAQYGIDGAI